MKFLKWSFAVSVLVGIVACQSDKSNRGSKLMTPNSGFEYEIYSTENGETPKEGEVVYFQFDIFDHNDSLLQTYRDQPQMPSVKIPEAGSKALGMNPVIDVLTLLGVGDSVGIIMPRDSIKSLPPGYDYVEHFLYSVVVKEIVDDTVHMARMAKINEERQKEAEAIMARYDDVEALAQKTIKEYKGNRLDVEEGPGGVKYFIHEKGDGELPAKGSTAKMQYYGALVKDGTFFDSSFKRGSPFSFQVGLGSVIKGWDQTIPLLPIGTKASLFIPSDMGYGDAGSPPVIPGGSELYFYVEVEDAK